MSINQISTPSGRFSWKPYREDLQDRLQLRARLDQLQCDPVAILAAFAMGLDPDTGRPTSIPIGVRALCAKELTSYAYPKLKQIEHIGDLKDEARIIVIGSVLDKDRYIEESRKQKQLEGK